MSEGRDGGVNDRLIPGVEKGDKSTMPRIAEAKTVRYISWKVRDMKKWRQPRG